jgi:hypothetical protein
MINGGAGLTEKSAVIMGSMLESHGGVNRLPRRWKLYVLIKVKCKLVGI